jgi:hypothetical protein
LSDPLSPLVESRFLEATIREHFEPLLDARFDDLLRAHYPLGIRFVVNGRALAREAMDEGEVALVAVRISGKRKPSAAGYLARRAGALAEDRRGVAISTYGKVIKRGWDWLGVMPAEADRIGGLIEAPALAASLTLNKADFLRAGPRGATFLAYRKAIQEAVGEQLARWGDNPSEHPAQHRRMARPIERDMETVLAHMADSFPMLAMLVKLRAAARERFASDRADPRTSNQTRSTCSHHLRQNLIRQQTNRRSRRRTPSLRSRRTSCASPRGRMWGRPANVASDARPEWGCRFNSSRALTTPSWRGSSRRQSGSTMRTRPTYAPRARVPRVIT